MRDSQWSMRGAFIMALHSWKSLQARILLADSWDDAMEIVTKCKECQFF
jgi:hypothetical protein